MGVMQASIRLARRLAGRPARFVRDVRGNVAMMFALTMPVLLLMTFAGIDIHRASSAKAQLQDALDAAALSAARSPFTAAADIQRVGMAALKANLQALPGIVLNEANTTFTLTPDDIVIGKAAGMVDVTIAAVFLPPYGVLGDGEIEIGAQSDVDRSARNIEVALVLDTTGSMDKDGRIGDLRAAAKELVEIVVQPEADQTPFYSKVAIVPYSMAVNVGDYAASARGAIAGSTDVTGASFSVGAARNITGATRGNPVKITSNNHGFVNGDVVWITNVKGMTQLNKKAFVVANADAHTFTLRRNGANVNGQNYGQYDENGTIRKCQYSNCAVVITSPSHGLENNDYVRFTDVRGMTQLNNQTFLVGNRQPNTFTIDMDAADSPSTYTSGGKAWCAQQGCTYFAFENVDEDLVTQKISTCVTERSGTNAYTDAAPGSALLGRNYPSAGNDCRTSLFRPLSSSKQAIIDDIDALTASGSTGGHIGVAWGWYAVSPNFASMFGEQGAGAYNTAKTLKSVIIMTDGEYNSGYCQGVIARNSTNGSGDRATHINCDAPNGHPFAQTLELCSAMRNAGVIVYTVGFKVVDDERARTMVNNCASSPANVHMANTGASLKEAFKAIGRDLTRLRISR